MRRRSVPTNCQIGAGHVHPSVRSVLPCKVSDTWMAARLIESRTTLEPLLVRGMSPLPPYAIRESDQVCKIATPSSVQAKPACYLVRNGVPGFNRENRPRIRNATQQFVLQMGSGLFTGRAFDNTFHSDSML